MLVHHVSAPACSWLADDLAATFTSFLEDHPKGALSEEGGDIDSVVSLVPVHRLHTLSERILAARQAGALQAVKPGIIRALLQLMREVMAVGMNTVLAESDNVSQIQVTSCWLRVMM
jgi:hypothetical protein